MQRKMFFQAPKMASLSAHLPLPLRFFPPTGTSSFCPVMGVEEVGEPAFLPASWLPTVGHSERRYQGNGSDAKWQPWEQSLALT